eukprot:2112722-Prymnesium_polylepis.1
MTGRWRKRRSIIVHSAATAVVLFATQCGSGVMIASTVVVSGSRPSASSLRATSVSVRMPLSA